MNDTPLHTVCSWGELEPVEVLLEHGADVRAVGDHGSSVLINAVVGRNPESIKLLIRKGADPHLRNDWGTDAIEYARNVSASKEILKALQPRKRRHESDWEGHELSSDSTWAHGIFFGKSGDELTEIFDSNPVEAAENIFRIPDKAFPYYFLQFGLHVQSVINSDDISKSDAASAFMNYLLAVSRERPHVIEEMAPSLLKIGDYIASHQKDYWADEDIYGSFLDVYEEIKKILSGF